MRKKHAHFSKWALSSPVFFLDEIVRTGMTLFPYITVGFVIVSVFSIVTVWITAFFFDQVKFISLSPNSLN